MTTRSIAACIAALFAVTGLLTGTARADETCMSPYMAKIVGQEDFVYIWTLGMEGVGDGQDKLVTVAVNPNSPDYGQVVASLSAESRLGQGTMIVSSDFERARQSAQIVHGLLGCRTDIRLEERLRERNFGDLELGSNRSYEEVWTRDAVNPDDDYRGVESANRVMRRVTSLIADLEATISGETFFRCSTWMRTAAPTRNVGLPPGACAPR